MVFVGVQLPKSIQQHSSGTHIIERFFQWLRGKNVQTIMKVIVQDDQMNPCGDQIIQAALNTFDVRYLDWDRVDISCKTLKACPNIRELSLYSSGNSAVLHGLAEKTGLRSLEKVKLSDIILYLYSY